MNTTPEDTHVSPFPQLAFNHIVEEALIIPFHNKKYILKIITKREMRYHKFDSARLFLIPTEYKLPTTCEGIGKNSPNYALLFLLTLHAIYAKTTRDTRSCTYDTYTLLEAAVIRARYTLAN